jgi:di/tricarboxylate transporter
MGSGGCRSAEYLRIGVPLNLVDFITVLFPLPWLWRLAG